MATNQVGAVLIRHGDANKQTLWQKATANAYTKVVGGSNLVAVDLLGALIAPSGPHTVDGVVCTNGMIVAASGGLYVVNTAGAWPKYNPFQPLEIFVTQGVVYGGRRLIAVAGPGSWITQNTLYS